MSPIYHNILLRKLIQCPKVSSNQLKEQERIHRLREILKKTKYKNVICGVPQGSILGPLLLIFISDASNCASIYLLIDNGIIYADDTNLIQGLFIRDETPHLGETSHLSEILFIPRLHEKNISSELDTFHPRQPACLFLSSDVTFIVYLFFCFYFKFELLISIRTAKFYEMNCTFSSNKYKNMPSLN